MVFSGDEKAVIKNDYLEKQWSAYRICKEHPTKKWHKTSVQNLSIVSKCLDLWTEDLDQADQEP